jgi:hypothetical protein
VGLESLRPLTHWVILTCFKRCLLYSRVPDLSRHEQRRARTHLFILVNAKKQAIWRR